MKIRSVTRYKQGKLGQQEKERAYTALLCPCPCWPHRRLAESHPAKGFQKQGPGVCHRIKERTVNDDETELITTFKEPFLIIPTSSYLATSKFCHTLYKILMKQTPNTATSPFSPATPLVQPNSISQLNRCPGLLFAFVVFRFALFTVVFHGEPDNLFKMGISLLLGVNSSKVFPLKLGKNKTPFPWTVGI